MTKRISVTSTFLVDGNKSQPLPKKHRVNTGKRGMSLNHPKIQQRLADMPETMRKTYIKAMEGKGFRAAIKAFCSECVGWVRNEVTVCTSVACPLYPYRPYQNE